MLVRLLAIALLCIFMLGAEGAPPREVKKDIFISRGWGAGGMPFSVLYMNPTFSSSSAVSSVPSSSVGKSSTIVDVAGHQRTPQSNQRKQHKSMPQVRTSMPNNTRPKNINRAPHSVIPQLFVSYGWGPLGK